MEPGWLQLMCTFSLRASSLGFPMSMQSRGSNTCVKSEVATSDGRTPTAYMVLHIWNRAQSNRSLMFSIIHSTEGTYQKMVVGARAGLAHVSLGTEPFK